MQSFVAAFFAKATFKAALCMYAMLAKALKAA